MLGIISWRGSCLSWKNLRAKNILDNSLCIMMVISKNVFHEKIAQFKAFLESWYKPWNGSYDAYIKPVVH